ncbi:hypothetical protein diail_5088 [Diaporthe ilicicola]|nr:hypothetical protein diail_5088 [Diaporthe ilicicola]
MSFIDGLGGQPPPFWYSDEKSGFVEFSEGIDPAELLYHDLPTEEDKQFCLSQLTRQTVKSLFEGAEYAYTGWKAVPSWFLVTKQDRGLPVEAQRMAIQVARDSEASVEVREVDSSHSPMLSRPQETAAFLIEAATSLSE